MMEEKNTINFEEVEGRELEKLKEKALSNQSVQALVSYSLDNYFSQKKGQQLKELLTEVQGSKYTRGETPIKVLSLMFEEINMNISFSIEGTELKVTGNIFVDGLSHSLQAVEEKVYPILSLKAQENGYEVDWHENPLYDSEELKNIKFIDTAQEAESASIQVSKCSVCSGVCNFVQGMSCGLTGTMACSVACAAIGGPACILICGAIWGVKCFSDNYLICGPTCKSLGYC
jgi:hypothetical protein